MPPRIVRLRAAAVPICWASSDCLSAAAAVEQGDATGGYPVGQHEVARRRDPVVERVPVERGNAVLVRLALEIAEPTDQGGSASCTASTARLRTVACRALPIPRSIGIMTMVARCSCTSNAALPVGSALRASMASMASATSSTAAGQSTNAACRPSLLMVASQGADIVGDAVHGLPPLLAQADHWVNSCFSRSSEDGAHP